MTEDLLRDLVEYKTYKDKAVMMASKSLIQLFRTTCPELLHKRDRGRPTEANIDLKRKEFGETDAAEFVPGAEVVEDEDEEGDDSDAEDESEEETDDEEGDGEEEKKAKEEEKMLTLEEKKEKARATTLSRVLTDEDFKKIDAAQLKKQVVGVRKGGKRGKKRKAEEANLAEEDEEEADGGRRELVNLEDIEMIYKKKRHDKEVCRHSTQPNLIETSFHCFYPRLGWQPSRVVGMRRESLVTRTRKIPTRQRRTNRSQRRRTSP